MFCAFEGRPLIVRLHGRGRVVEPGDGEWDEPDRRFPEYPGARSVVVVDVERVADSCGFAVPLYEYRGERSQLIDWAEHKGPEGLEKYKAQKNRASIDGLAGLRSAGATGDEGERLDDPGHGRRRRGGTRPRQALVPLLRRRVRRLDRREPSASRASRPRSPACRADTPRPRGACCWRWRGAVRPVAWRCGTSATAPAR